MDKLNFESPARVALVTQGCKVNQYETQVLVEDLLARGWELVSLSDEPDLLLVNSCTVTEASDRDLRKLLRKTSRTAPKTRVLVTGCKAEIDPEEVRSMEGSPHALGNDRKMSIPGILSGEDVPELPDQERLEDLPITRFDGRGRAILKVQDGCNLRCSFCIVPLARGDSRSRPSTECLSRVKALQESGFQEVVLSGIQLGFYRDPDSKEVRLPELLARLLDRTRGLRFRLGSLLPKHVSKELLDLFESEPDRLCPHFHVSLQSGDDRILRSMKRPYTSAEYRETLERIRDSLSNVCLGTDVITGYPGESDESFETTRAFLRSLPLHYAHVFPFSPRPGTPASTLEGALDRSLAMKRGAILRGLFREKGEEYRREQIGRTLQVLAETPIPGGRMRGSSENYQKVHYSAEGVRPGEIWSMKVSGLEGDGLSAGRIEGQS